MNFKGGKKKIFCAKCRLDFLVSPGDFKRKFCSKNCAYKSKNRSDSIVSTRMAKGSFKVSDATREKMSISHKGVPLSAKHREVLKGRIPWNFLGRTKQEISWQKNKRNRVLKRLREKSGSHSFDEWLSIKALTNFSCACCTRKEPEISLTVDHIIPLSRGGSDRIENIQPLCRSCNSKKHVQETNFLAISM